MKATLEHHDKQQNYKTQADENQIYLKQTLEDINGHMENPATDFSISFSDTLSESIMCEIAAKTELGFVSNEIEGNHDLVGESHHDKLLEDDHDEVPALNHPQIESRDSKRKMEGEKLTPIHGIPRKTLSRLQFSDREGKDRRRTFHLLHDLESQECLAEDSFLKDEEICFDSAGMDTSVDLFD